MGTCLQRRHSGHRYSALPQQPDSRPRSPGCSAVRGLEKTRLEEAAAGNSGCCGICAEGRGHSGAPAQNLNWQIVASDPPAPPGPASAPAASGTRLSPGRARSPLLLRHKSRPGRRDAARGAALAALAWKCDAFSDSECAGPAQCLSAQPPGGRRRPGARPPAVTAACGSGTCQSETSRQGATSERAAHLSWVSCSHDSHDSRPRRRGPHCGHREPAAVPVTGPSQPSFLGQVSRREWSEWKVKTFHSK